ncbi:MAG: DUF6444 domain-containing protein [Gemmataceae bacterium]
MQWQAEQIERLTKRIAELEAQCAKNSTNSSKPPSTEHSHAKTKPSLDYLRELERANG